MKDIHIVDKLMRLAVILVMLGASIVLYNTVIDYFSFDEGEYSDYCIEETSHEGYCMKSEAYLEEYRSSYFTRVNRNMVSVIYTLGLSVGFLYLLKKKDLTKNGLITKIMNGILLLTAFGGAIGFGSLVINEFFYGITWENIFRSAGLVIWPLLFYFVLNKYVFVYIFTNKKKKKKKRA